MYKRSRSTVWNHFTKSDEEDYVTCQILGCKKFCQNTSNLLKHLKSKHVVQYEACLEERRMSNESSTTKRRKQDLGTQVTLQQSLDKATKYSKDSNKRRRIDNSLIEMIVGDLQPPSIVENKGFKNLIETLDIKYELPSRRTIMRRILPEKYDNV